MKTFALGIFILSSYAATTLAAEPQPACEAKRKNIESQIVEATARGVKKEIAGLQKALESNKASCTDKSLADERENKVQKAQQKVTDREKDLSEAQIKGDLKKIATRKLKLEEARAELVEAEKPLLR